MFTSIVIISSFIVLILFLKFVFNPVYNLIYFRYVKFLADAKWTIYGKQYFIMQVGNRFMIIDREGCKRYNKIARKRNEKQITYIELISHSCYKTKSGALTR